MTRNNLGQMQSTVLAILGPTASGKSALGLAVAERYHGEIINCDSTAVYRGFDIGTDKLPVSARQGIPHHLIDIADPVDTYSAAKFSKEASNIVREIQSRGKVPILVGGTGFYYRALTRGLFPGPGADEALRSRLMRISKRYGDKRLHRVLRRVDPESGNRIMPRDRLRLIRALEVYFTTGESLTSHFSRTVSPIQDLRVVAFALHLPPDVTAKRVARRVDQQFDRGIVEEARQLLAQGVPASARPFGGLVYRQILKQLRGEQTEKETRELIVRENRRYARRQLIWLRKEPNLVWLNGPGDQSNVLESVHSVLLDSRVI